MTQEPGIERMSPVRFTHDRWAAGSLATFGLETRYASITQSRGLIRRHAIGYCPGPSLHFRPKPDCMGVMFWTEAEDTFWTHLTDREFAACFPEVTV
jgi:hypothetical protein